MSFGFGVGDIILVSQLALRVVEGTRQACGAYDELTREVFGLHIALNALEREVNKPNSVLNSDNDNRKNELARLASNCKEVLEVLDGVLKKYNRLSDRKRSLRSYCRRVGFGADAVRDLSGIRLELVTHTYNITIFLNVLSMGSLGKIEEGLTMLVNQAVASLQAQTEHGEGSILTSYANDDTSFWKEIRRELIRANCPSHVLRKHKMDMLVYVKALGNQGALDDLPETPELVESDDPPVSLSADKESKPVETPCATDGSIFEERIAEMSTDTLETSPKDNNEAILPNAKVLKYHRAQALDESPEFFERINLVVSPVPSIIEDPTEAGAAILEGAPLYQYPRDWSNEWPHVETNTVIHAAHCGIFLKLARSAVAGKPISKEVNMPQRLSVPEWDMVFRQLALMDDIFFNDNFWVWVYDWLSYLEKREAKYFVPWDRLWQCISRMLSVVYFCFLQVEQQKKSRSLQTWVQEAEQLLLRFNIVVNGQRMRHKVLFNSIINFFMFLYKGNSHQHPEIEWLVSAECWSSKFNQNWESLAASKSFELMHSLRERADERTES